MDKEIKEWAEYLLSDHSKTLVKRGTQIDFQQSEKRYSAIICSKKEKDVLIGHLQKIGCDLKYNPSWQQLDVNNEKVCFVHGNSDRVIDCIQGMRLYTALVFDVDKYSENAHMMLMTRMSEPDAKVFYVNKEK